MWFGGGGGGRRMMNYNTMRWGILHRMAFNNMIHQNQTDGTTFTLRERKRRRSVSVFGILKIYFSYLVSHCGSRVVSGQWSARAKAFV